MNLIFRVIARYDSGRYYFIRSKDNLILNLVPENSLIKYGIYDTIKLGDKDLCLK